MAVQAAAESNTRPLHRSFEAARRRLWWQKGILILSRSLCLGLVVTLIAALLAAWQAPLIVQGGFWTVGLLAPLAGTGAALVLRPSRSQAVRLLDLRLGLRQQLGTAEELLTRRASGRLVRLQITRAAVLAEDLPMTRAFPLWPKREVALVLLLAATTASLLTLVSLGVTLPNPLSLLRLPSLLGEKGAPVEQEPFVGQQQRDAAAARSPAMDPVRQMLEEIQRQSLRGALSPAAAAAALARANAELNRVASESRLQREALDRLSNELQGTAAGREAARSLRQGDYEPAAQQLAQIGSESDQLSTTAKQELADALNRASYSSKAGELAQKESEAAQALQSNDYSSTVQSMEQLAQSVRESSQQMVPQSELADAWQQLQKMDKQLGGQGSPLKQARGSLSPPVAQAPSGPSERRGNMQQAAPGDQPAEGGGSGERQAGAQDGGRSSGGQAGNTRGGPPLGNPNHRLGPDGQPLDVEGKLGDSIFGEPSSDTQPPKVLREGTADSITSSGEEGASGPISVPAEKVLVPGERRPTVRDYFSKGSGGQ